MKMMIKIWFSGFLKKDDLRLGLISSLLLILLLPIIVLLNPDNQNIIIFIYIWFFGKDESELAGNDRV